MNKNNFKTIILKKGSKNIRVSLKSKSNVIEDLGIFKDINTAKKAAEKAKARLKQRAEALKFEKAQSINESEELKASQEEEIIEQEKIDIPENWEPNYGNKVYHCSLGAGIIRKIIKSKDPSTSELHVTKIGIDFEEHGNVDIEMPSKDIKLFIY